MLDLHRPARDLGATCFLTTTMASSVFYRWNSRKDESRVTFDGTGISVFDLKRDIIISNNMTKANDFDLIVLDNTSKQGVSHSSANTS